MPNAAPEHRSKRNIRHRTGWHASINSEIVSVANSGDVALLVATIEKHLHEMNLVNITTAIHRLAKLVESGAQSQKVLVQHPVLPKLTFAAQERLKSISADRSAPSCQALSNIMWSLAVLQIPDWSLLQEVSLLTVNYIAYFKPLELSTLLWAFAKILPEAPRRSGSPHWVNSVFEAAVDYIRSNVQKFTFRNLITAVGAFATIGKSSPVLFQTVAVQMLRTINTANRLELAKTAWAFGAANVHNDKLFCVVAKHAIPQLHSFQQQELSNLLWGFASNSVFHQELFAKASFCAQRMELNAQQLANILWALTRMRPQWSIASRTMRVLMPRCCEQLQAFKPQEFATIAIAAAKVFGHVGEDLGQLDEPLPSEVTIFFSSALPIMLPQFHQFSDQSLANVATAYTALRATGVMGVLANAGQLALTRLHRLDPPLLLQFIRTFSTDFAEFEASAEQRLTCKGLAQAFFSEASRRLGKFGLEEQRSLGQLCCRSQGVHSDFDVEELRQKCLRLSGNIQISVAKGLEEKKMHRSRNSPSNKMKINLEEASLLSPASTTSPASVLSPQNAVANISIHDDVEESLTANVPSAHKDDSPQRGASRQGFNVKNTFVEPDDQNGPENYWVSQMVLSRPPLDFLDEGKRAMHAEFVQALREDYQHLRAVEGLDFHPTANDTSAGDKRPQEQVPVDTSVVCNADSPVWQPRKHSVQVTGPSASDLMASDRRIKFESKALQAFRQDYQELRAVPGLDWNTRHGPWLIQTSESLYATSTCMKQNNRCAELDDLPSPLPFLEESSEIEALRKFYRTTGEFTAVPGVDFSPQKVKQNETESAIGVNMVPRLPLTGPPLCEPKALSRPPMDFLDDLKADRTSKDLKGSSSRSGGISAPNDFSTVGAGSQHLATLENPPDHEADSVDSLARDVPQRQTSHHGEPVLQGTAPDATVNKESERRRIMQSKALQAFRKDYQELRAVPGLDWNTKHGPWLQQSSESLYATSACMKQHNRCAELGGLPSPLPFLEESTEIETLRQFYRTTGEFTAVPGVDFPVPQKRRESEAQAALGVNPLRITPSGWLLELQGTPLCEPKALSRPALDFLDETQAMHGVPEDISLFESSTAKVSAENDFPMTGRREQHAVTSDQVQPTEASDVDSHTTDFRAVPKRDSTPPRRQTKISESSPIDSSPFTTRSEASEKRHTLNSPTLQAFRQDYQELRAVPGLDWSLEHGPWLAEDSESLYATSACMKQQNRCAEAAGLPPPLPFLEQNAEIESLRQFYRSTGEFTAVPGVDFSLPHKVQQNKVQAASEAIPLRITPSTWLLEGDVENTVFSGPPLCEPKALSRPPLDFLE